METIKLLGLGLAGIGGLVLLVAGFCIPPFGLVLAFIIVAFSN